MDTDRDERSIRRALAKRSSAIRGIEDLHRQASIIEPDDLTISQFLIAVHTLDEL